MKIVVAEKVAPSCLAVFKEQSDWKIVSPDKDTLAAELAEADALLVRSAVFVDGAMMDKAPKLRVIGRAGVGVDNIDLDAATKRGICVMNTPGGNAIAVAEHTLALMLALARHLTRADSTTHAGKWEKKSLQGTELRAKTLGIVGLGKIGMEVAKRAQVFGMKVVAHDPFVAASLAQQLQIALVTLDELFAQADYITLHVGLTPQTQGIINAANEPLKESAYQGRPNVILTPHIAGSTNEAQDAVGVQIAMQVREYLQKGVIQNAVNVPSVTFDEYTTMLPYIGLAERLGTFLAQSGENGAEEITIAYGGELTEWKTDLIRNAAVAGVLNQMAHEKANLVNARSIAEERGIRVHEQKTASAGRGAAVNTLTVSLKTHAQARAVLGTVLHGNSPRLLRIDEIDVEAPLQGNIIYMRNRDVPGVIGRVGTVLGQHGVNIANFSLGRAEDGKEPRGAVAVVQVDSDVSETVLQDLRKIDAVEVAKAIRF